MENVLIYLEDMIQEQINERQRILKNIDQLEADLELDMEEKEEFIEELYKDLACVSYMIRKLRSKRAYVAIEVEFENWRK